MLVSMQHRLRDRELLVMLLRFSGRRSVQAVGSSFVDDSDADGETDGDDDTH